MKEPVYRLEKLNFSGPLDLLLHLIEKNKVDIYDIPIAEITAQYMEYVRRMEETDLELVSAFLVMAATLLEIKARMLLPKEEVPEEETEEDPREALVARLLEYRKFQYIAEELCGMEEEAARSFYGTERLPEELVGYTPPADPDSLLAGVTLEALQQVFREVLAREAERSDPVRADFREIQKERISLSEKIGSLLRYTRRHRRYAFRQILSDGRGRMEVVVTFLALLELMKFGKIEVTQKDSFSEIEVQATALLDRDDDPDLSGPEDAQRFGMG